MKLNKMKVGLGLLIVLALLLAAHILLVIFDAQGNELLSFLRMDFEGSLLTWFSQVVLLFIPALFVFYISFCKYKVKDKFWKQWLFFGFILVFLSIDDGAMIHEKFSKISELIGLQSALDSVSAAWFDWSWWVIYGVIFVIIALFFVRWFFQLPNRTKIFFSLAVFVMLVGQVGLEAVTGFLNHGGEYNVMLRGIEKFIGRSGLIILLISLLDYIQLMPNKERADIKLQIT